MEGRPRDQLAAVIDQPTVNLSIVTDNPVNQSHSHRKNKIMLLTGKIITKSVNLLCTINYFY